MGEAGWQKPDGKNLPLLASRKHLANIMRGVRERATKNAHSFFFWSGAESSLPILMFVVSGRI